MQNAETRELSNTETKAFATRFAARLRELTGVPSGFVALHEPEFRGGEWTFVKQCLDSGWVSSAGEFVNRFEADIAAVCGASHGVAVVNGTAALQIAMKLVGVVPGDEVLAPALTFVATANAISHLGAMPHFVDCEPQSLGVDAAALRKHLAHIARREGRQTINRETGKRIGALVVMHAFGHPADLDALAVVAAEFEIPLVEDAAESLGSHYKGRAVGAFGRVGALSFNGNKILTTGGGGAIVTNDPELARHAKHLVTTAKKPHAWAFDHDEIGFNYRMPNLNAALGCAQLGQLENFVQRKRRLAQRYIAGFAEFEGLTPLIEPSYAESNYWLNAVLLAPDHANARDAVLDHLNATGLMCRPVWTPMHRLAIYAHCPHAALPVTDDIAARLINIPSSAKLAGTPVVG